MGQVRGIPPTVAPDRPILSTIGPRRGLGEVDTIIAGENAVSLASPARNAGIAWRNGRFREDREASVSPAG